MQENLMLKDRVLEKLQGSYDLLTHAFNAGKIRCCIVMIDGMTNKEEINRFIVTPLLACDRKIAGMTAEDLIRNILPDSEMSPVTTLDKAVKAILDGDAVLFADGMEDGVQIGAKGFSKRGISEPPDSVVIKGPREGFTEDMKTNSILLRRKLKSPDLKLVNMKIGKYSNTNVLLCFIDSITDKKLVEDTRQKLQSIDIDGILDSSYISDFLSGRKQSLFKQTGNTEKPDILASKLLEGRIGIIVDGSPIALTLPFMLLEDYQSPQDYYDKAYRATFSRLIRLISSLISVFLPAFYVAAESFHLQLLPLRFLLKTIASIREIPLAPALEMFVVLIIFEILRESSLRMPRHIGSALSIVGGLVLGDTAVRAGIISPPAIIVVALSSIAMYTVPDQESALTVLRIIFLILGASLGLIGILSGIVFTGAYLVSLSSYGTPYLAPFAPLVHSDIKDGFMKKPLTDMVLRPESLPNQNNVRLAQKEED